MDAATPPIEAPPSTRTLRQFALDWWPILLILVAYAVLHELADEMVPRAHVDPQLAFDEWLFGTVPTVQLQRELWSAAHVHWYDYLTWLVYLSHFFVTLTVAIVLWFVVRPEFLRFRALILTVTFLGFATYLLYPAFPPWLASTRGDMPETVRVVREIWLHLDLKDVAAVFGEKSNYAFPVGALPSLHAAWPFMIMLFFWSRAGWWRILLVGYALAMSFTLVYTADHFVFDILLGWLYASVVYAAFSWLWRRRHRPASIPSPSNASLSNRQNPVV